MLVVEIIMGLIVFGFIIIMLLSYKEWGFVPLKRSSYLVKGMRGVVFLIIFFFGIFSCLLSMWFLRVVANASSTKGPIGWLELQIIVFGGSSTLLSLFGLASNTVLFVYCKASHGESASQIDDGFSVVYVQLPPDVVNVV